MIYVRTKDKILKYDGGTEICVNGKWLSIDKVKIISQADTIKELCDGFVVVLNGRSLKHTYFKTFDKAQKYYRDLTLCAYPKSQVKIYGIICSYNDKLIPELKTVAELDDKGELCLI